MATHLDQPSILAWKIPQTENFWWATVRGVAKSWTRLTPHPHYFLNVGVPQSSDPNPFLTSFTTVASLVSKLDLSSECETYI